MHSLEPIDLRVMLRGSLLLIRFRSTESVWFRHYSRPESFGPLEAQALGLRLALDHLRRHGRRAAVVVQLPLPHNDESPHAGHAAGWDE